jgi:hypothetical protein
VHRPQLLKLLMRTEMWAPHDVQAAGCVLRAIDATHERRAKNAFCLVRVSLWGCLPRSVITLAYQQRAQENHHLQSKLLSFRCAELSLDLAQYQNDCPVSPLPDLWMPQYVAHRL